MRIIADVWIKGLNRGRRGYVCQNEVGPGNSTVRASLQVRNPTLPGACAYDLLVKKTDHARAVDCQRGVGCVGDRQQVSRPGPCLATSRRATHMQCQKAAGRSGAPHQKDVAAVVWIDSNRDTAANALLSGRSGSVTHERKANACDHPLSRKRVARRGGQVPKIDEAASTPVIVSDHDHISAGDHQSVCREAAGESPPSVESCVDCAISMRDRPALWTVLPNSGALFDANGTKGRGGSDSGIE